MRELLELLELDTLFKKTAKMTPEEQKIHELGQAIISENWVKLRQIADRDNLNGGEYLDRVAMAACHVYAAAREPKRCREWTAIQTLLEVTHFTEWAQAVEARHKLDNPE